MAAKKRITYHNGRHNKQGVYSAKHNDRRFDIEKAEHIEPSETDKNIYWHYYQKSSPEMSFEQCELKYYKEHFSDYLMERNNKSIKQGHKERVQSIDNYHKSQKSCPEETIVQIGNIANKISSQQLREIFAEYWAWRDKNYPNCVTLDIAYHADEQGAGHIHDRHVWVAHDSAGREMVNQGAALREMGVERPETNKKESRYNNAKMSFTIASRAKLAEICKSYGVEIETEPKEASKSGKDLLAWQVEQDKIKRDTANAEREKAEVEHKETLEKIARAETYLAEISEEAEAEKKRAEEIKALAEAENNRLADLRVADAERQRQEIAQKQRLENLKNEANKEKVRAEKNKMLADEAEARLRQDEEWLKRANEKIDKILDKAEIATAKANAAEKREKEALERIEDLTRKKEKIDAETEKEKKRAGEIKALAEAENKRLADLRVADAERQRQHEVELQNLKEKADKEEMRAKKNKALADAEETRLVEIRAADAERQRLFEIEENARQQQKKEAEQHLENTKKKANEAEAWLKKANQQADILTQKKEKIDSDISQLRIYQQQVENDVENSECELKLLKLQTEEAIENKGKSVRIISQITEPILEVSEAIQSKNKNKLWIAVQGLVKAFGAIAEHIPFFKIMQENQELIENQKFSEAYENLIKAETELTAEDRGLKFLRSVVRVHGINNYNTINSAIQAVADTENKDTAFEVQLSQMLRQTDEYKSQQTQTTATKQQYYYGN